MSLHVPGITAQAQGASGPSVSTNQIAGLGRAVVPGCFSKDLLADLLKHGVWLDGTATTTAKVQNTIHQPPTGKGETAGL